MNRHTLHALGLMFFALALVAGCGDDDEPTAPTANPNYVWVESQTASPGDTVQVVVRIANDRALAGVEVPIKFTGTQFNVEGMQFGDSLPTAIATVDCDTVSSRVDLVWITLPTPLVDMIEPGQWLFAKVEVRISPDAVAQEILIANYTYVAGCPALGVFDPGSGLHTVSFVDSQGNEIERKPAFTGGKITVVAP